MTAPAETTMNCPSEETLAAFIDGRLDGEARRRVVEHMASCGECRDVAVMAAEIASAEQPAGDTSNVTRFTPRAKWGAALAAAAVILILFSPMLREQFFRGATPMDDLVEASGSLRYRVFRARLSGDFPYREYRSPLRSGNGSPVALDEQYWKIFSVAGELKARAGDDPSVKQLHALGVSHLLIGQPEPAVEFLEDAVKQETGEADILEAIDRSTDAMLLNDLAVGYQALIERHGKLEVQGAAVQAVRRAWSLQRTPQIAWTRALVIESLHVRDEAVAAWKDYLALDRNSEWAAEAQRQIDELMRPPDSARWPSARETLWALQGDAVSLRSLVASFPQQVRLWCEDELLAEWGTAFLKGTPTAPERLEKIAALGILLAEVNGESDVSAAVEAIRAADPETARELARGHVAYAAGRRAIVSPTGSVALRQMDIAVETLTPERTRFAWRARAEHVGAVYQSNDYARANRELETLVESLSDHAPSKALQARIHWIHALLALQQGAPADAVERYARALEIYRQLGERDFECALHSYLAAALERAGRPADASRERDAALLQFAKTGESARYHPVMFEAAFAAIRKDQPALAELFLDATVRHDVSKQDYVTACTSIMWRGAYRFRRGEHDGATADLLDARDICGRIADDDVRSRMLANLGLARAYLRPERATPEELVELDSSIAYFQKTGSRVWLGSGYLTRARAFAARGDVHAAENDFRLALTEVQASRRAIPERDARMHFTATSDEVVDRYVEFLLTQNREQDAFEIADASRFRELVDAPGARWQSSPTPVAMRLQNALPAGVHLVEFRVTYDRIVVWVIDSRSFETRILDIEVADARRMVARLDPETTEAEFQAVTGDLYDHFIEPLEPLLRDASTLVIVPDDWLDRIPYAALYERKSGWYAAERRATLVVPSANLFLQSAQRFRERALYDEEMLIVQAARAEGTEVIPETRREVRSLASMHSARVLGEGVSAARVLDAAANATSIHFASHGMEAGIRLGGDARLDERDVAAATLPRTRLVYLSACDSDSGPGLKSEGSVTIARSFFAAGVPAIVATLWPVDDSTAQRIAASFYELLREGSSPAEALRGAQSRFLAHRTGTRPDWAAFRVIGGGIPLQKHPA